MKESRRRAKSVIFIVFGSGEISTYSEVLFGVGARLQTMYLLVWILPSAYVKVQWMIRTIYLFLPRQLPKYQI